MQCPRCGTRMALNDETTKLNEYACEACHAVQIKPKSPVAGRTI